MRTAGASGGKIKTNADAKMKASSEQLMAYDGSYVRGYTAGSAVMIYHEYSHGRMCTYLGSVGGV